MPKLKLTQQEIKKITSPTTGRVDYFDTELKGFLLRVSADYQDKKGEIQKGSRVFYVQVDAPDPATGKHVTRKAKIGHYGEYTPEQARQKAPEIIKRLREGKPISDEVVPSLKDLYHRYIKDKGLKDTTAAAYKVYFENEKGSKFSTWLDLPINQLEKALTPDVVISRYQSILSDSGKGAVSNSFKMLQAIINYGRVLFPQHISRNPVKVITNADLWPEIKSRTTSLDPEQYKQFYDALQSFSV